MRTAMTYQNVNCLFPLQQRDDLQRQDPTSAFPPFQSIAAWN